MYFEVNSLLMLYLRLHMGNDLKRHRLYFKEKRSAIQIERKQW